MVIPKGWFRKFWGPGPTRPVLPTSMLPPIEQMSIDELRVVAQRYKDHIAELNSYIEYVENRCDIAVAANRSGGVSSVY